MKLDDDSSQLSLACFLRVAFPRPLRSETSSAPVETFVTSRQRTENLTNNRNTFGFQLTEKSLESLICFTLTHFHWTWFHDNFHVKSHFFVFHSPEMKLKSSVTTDESSHQRHFELIWRTDRHMKLCAAGRTSDWAGQQKHGSDSVYQTQD